MQEMGPTVFRPYPRRLVQVTNLRYKSCYITELLILYIYLSSFSKLKDDFIFEASTSSNFERKKDMHGWVSIPEMRNNTGIWLIFILESLTWKMKWWGIRRVWKKCKLKWIHHHYFELGNCLKPFPSCFYDLKFTSSIQESNTFSFHSR